MLDALPENTTALVFSSLSVRHKSSADPGKRLAATAKPFVVFVETVAVEEVEWPVPPTAVISCRRCPILRG